LSVVTGGFTVMRFPIYVFFLMSGFFYLTGNPFTDETSKTGEPGIQGKVANLKYSRRINAPLKVDKTAETSANSADGKITATAKPYTVAASSKSTSVSDAKMQPSAVAIAQEPDRVTSPATGSTPENKSFTQGKAKLFKDPARKPLDWTVFGNKRKNAALTVPVRTRSQDEIDAEGIEDEPKQARRYNPRKLASKTRKYNRAKLKRKSKRLKAQRAARKARKAKRLARLKRRSKGVYRIARKAKKKPTEKKTVANKPRRKKFGFTQVGVQSRLSW